MGFQWITWVKSASVTMAIVPGTHRDSSAEDLMSVGLTHFILCASAFRSKLPAIVVGSSLISLTKRSFFFQAKFFPQATTPVSSFPSFILFCISFIDSIIKAINSMDFSVKLESPPPLGLCPGVCSLLGGLSLSWVLRWRSDSLLGGLSLTWVLRWRSSSLLGFGNLGMRMEV